MAKISIKQYLKLQERFPEFLDAVESLGKTASLAGPLDEKVRHLVQLAAAAALRSEGAVHSHTRRAAEAGASPEEIRHALLVLTSTIGFPTISAAMTWVDDVLESDSS